MKRVFPQSIQGRLALLVGALTLTAAVTTLLGIVNAAAFQQQLAIVENYAVTLQKTTNARADLLKMQISAKNVFVTEDYRAQDYGNYWRYSQQLDDYLFAQSMRNMPVEQMMNQNALLDEEVNAFFEEIYLDDDPDLAKLAQTNLENIDPAIMSMEAQTQAFYTQDLLAMREQIAAIEESTRVNILIGQIALLVLAGLLVWSVYETMNISRPLDNLTCAIVAFENKTYQPELLAEDARRPDELGELARAVGAMAQSISESNRLKEQFLQAAERFIPTQYLEFLEKDSITKVRLGDHVSAEMAVMFSDIRGFTSMSEKMTAQENFDFVNEYLKLVSPIIQKYEGFIVKFLGDGMMAIFPYGVADAVQAGIEKAQTVQTFNQLLKSRGLPPISVGIGVHTGPMMVGMIGEELRMQGDAFSDNVNLTSRIEGLNKFYGTSMIISEDTLRQMPQPVSIKMRSLGKAVVKGRAGPLEMYEVYDGLAPEQVAIKDATRTDFECAIHLYSLGKVAEAGQLFTQVAERDPSDKTARLYVELCAGWIGRPIPADWDGSIMMTDK
jgi:class 3 adenylate cyclase